MNFKFCPNCGRPGTVQKLNETDYECSNCAWHFWNNAKATATAIFLRKDHQILFAKRGRKTDPKFGYYDLPGGFLEYNEHAVDALAREMKEETGLIIKNPKLFTVYGGEYIPGVISTCDLLFVITEWEGEPEAQDDVAALAWKPIEIVESEQFAWNYTGFVQDLYAFIEKNNL